MLCEKPDALQGGTKTLDYVRVLTVSPPCAELHAADKMMVLIFRTSFK